MPLTLRPMREADLPAYDRIVNDAFSAGGLMTLFYPDGYSDADREHSYAQTLEHMQDPIYRYMLAIDTDLPPLPEDLLNTSNDTHPNGTHPPTPSGRVVGVSVWKIHTTARTEADLAKEAQDKASDTALPPTADKEFMSAFFTAIGNAKREHLGGRPHVLLHILATDPAHHRRGVGALALKWGLDEADRLGLEAYLEASEMGRPLYERWGFEKLGMLEFSAKAMGRGREVPHTIMLRPGRGALV